jgi:hypothetical protein
MNMPKAQIAIPMEPYHVYSIGKTHSLGMSCSTSSIALYVSARGLPLPALRTALQAILSNVCGGNQGLSVC